MKRLILSSIVLFSILSFTFSVTLSQSLGNAFLIDQSKSVNTVLSTVHIVEIKDVSFYSIAAAANYDSLVGIIIPRIYIDNAPFTVKGARPFMIASDTSITIVDLGEVRAKIIPDKVVVPRGSTRTLSYKFIFTEKQHNQILDLFTFSNTVFLIQHKLNKLGYNAGRPDGMPGKSTFNAVRSYQRDNGLPPTGKIDAATANKMGVPFSKRTQD